MDTTHVDQVLAFPLLRVQRCNPPWRRVQTSAALRQSGVRSRRWEVRCHFPQEGLKEPACAQFGKLAKVAITAQKVEGIEGEIVLLIRGEFGLEFGEIRSSVLHTTTTSPSMIA